MLGAMMLPTSGMSSTQTHGIPVVTALGAITLITTLLVWQWQKRNRGGDLRLSAYAIAALLLILGVAAAQLSISSYAQSQTVYQCLMFWGSGLLLGTILAFEPRMADRIALLAMPLATFAIFETATSSPNIWSDIVGAKHFDYIPHAGGDLRASSTFGHPLVAGTALIIMAFLMCARPGRIRWSLFTLVIVGAITTVSRSALLGLLAGLLVYFIGSPRQRLQLIGAVTIVIIFGSFAITVLPALQSSFEARVLADNGDSQEKRLNSLHILDVGLSEGSSELLAGRGLGGSATYLGRTQENLGLKTYDNQYITLAYDSGIFVACVAIGLFILGVIRARPRARRLAPLVVSATTMIFFDGLYWNSTGLLFWMTVGLATAPTVAAAKEMTQAVEHHATLPVVLPGVSRAASVA